jgi:predicted lipoprotein
MNEHHPAARSFFSASRTRTVLILLVACAIIVFLCLHPPFVIKPLQPIASSGPATANGTPDKASSFVEPVWKAKVIPTILAKAVDASVLLPEIKANPEAAGQKYGRREATNPFNYMIKGSGKVTQVNTESRAGTMTVEIGNGGSHETINLQVGPVVIGTALRDATGLVSFNQFTNQTDYAGVSKEMNLRAIKDALAGRDPASFAGKTIQFFGTFTFDPKSTSPIRVTPVKLEIVNS